VRLTDLIETFKGHDKVIFKLTGIGEMEYSTVEFKDAIDTIEALQQENEQLRVQVEQVREALRKAREALCKGISELKVHCKYFDQTPEEDACIEMYEAVVEIDKAIGGKEDE